MFITYNTFIFDTLLAKRTGFPTVLRTFVATYMEIFTREEWSNFGNHILKEFEDIVFACAQHDRFNAPSNTRCNCLACARQFRISRDGSTFMTRHFDFRNDGDVTSRSVFDNILDLLLCVEATVSGTFAIHTCRTDLCQLRIFLDLDTPALIICQMPMQTIDLEHSQYINLFLDVIDGYEMAADIDHHTTPFEARFVFDGDCRNVPSHIADEFCTFDLSRQQLQ